MNFEKLSFRPTEEQKAHLTNVSKKHNINNPTELIRKILDDHRKLNADDNEITNIRPHNVMDAKRKRQTNAMQTKRDTICRHGDQSEASANSGTVDKADLIVDTINAYSAGDNIEDGQQSLLQGKMPVIMRQSDYFGSPLGKVYGRLQSEIPNDYDVHDQWSSQMKQISLWQLQIMIWQYQSMRPQVGMDVQYMPSMVANYGYPMMNNIPQRTSLDMMDVFSESFEKTSRFMALVNRFRS